jgi:hypothetical protein
MKGIAYAFDGRGFMKYANRWKDMPLDDSIPKGQQAREDVHACMVVRLNPLGRIETMWMGGADLRDDLSAIPGDYYQEAFWVAAYNSSRPGAAPDIHVWPSRTLVESCGGNAETVEKALRHRVCAEQPEFDCQLTVHTDQACRSSDGGTPVVWDCDIGGGTTKPAVETRLNAEGWSDRYADSCPLSATASPSISGP